jgi:hypothetical protein
MRIQPATRLVLLGVHGEAQVDANCVCDSGERKEGGQAMNIKSDGKPIPTKLGTVQTVNVETGQVIEERHNAMTLLGPPPGVCQVCAVDHPHDQPHNQQSLYYQMKFRATHGRDATWSDAMAHCPEDVRQQWRQGLVALMRSKGMKVPADLMEQKPVGR